MKITTAFLDLGNTIVNYHSGDLTDEEKDFLGLVKMHNKLKENRIDISFDNLINSFYIPWIKQLKYRKDFKQEFNIKEFLPEKINDFENLFEECIINFHEPSARFAVLMPGVKIFLNELKNKGIRNYIISNSPIPGKCHDQTLKHLGVIEYFSNTFYSYDIGIRKPSLEIFKYALKQSNSNPNECIIIGDNFHLDVLPAKKLGIKAFFYNSKNNKDITYKNSIKDFSEILEKLN